MVSKGREQHLNLDPAGSIESDSYARRLVSQHQGQELGGPTIVHQDSVAPRPLTDGAAGAEMVAEDGGSDPGSVEPPD